MSIFEKLFVKIPYEQLKENVKTYEKIQESFKKAQKEYKEDPERFIKKGIQQNKKIAKRMEQTLKLNNQILNKLKG